MEYQEVPTEESKSSYSKNPSNCEKNMRDEVIAMEESKSTDQIIYQSDYEKNIKHQVIVMEESDSSDARYMYGDKEADEDASADVALISIVFCWLLIIFPILGRSSGGREFMAKYHDIIMILLIPLILEVQAIILVATLDSSLSSSRIFDILFMFLLSSILSVIEVSVFSWKVAIMTMILWIILIASVVMANWKMISSEDIVFSSGVKKLVAFICVLCICYTVGSMMYNLHY